MEEFPKSEYSKEVGSIFERTNKFLRAGIPDSGVDSGVTEATNSIK
jgi:hypothetical protein